MIAAMMISMHGWIICNFTIEFVSKERMELDMNKTDKEFLLAHGYKEVLNIKNVIQQGRAMNLHIEVYKDEPSMLLARVKEKNVIITMDSTWTQDERLIITQTDKLKTHIFSVPLTMIANVLVEAGKNITTILFNIKGDSYTYKICYKS